MLKGYTTTAASVITAALKSVTRFAVQVFVALVLGFFMLWDLPSIARGVASLKHSRLAPVYEEVAPVLGVFGRLFGKALQAQARIAVANTALTALGMWALAVPGVGLLSLFVFVCSFIPIAGVVISTAPIAFVALTEYGAPLLFLPPLAAAPLLHSLLQSYAALATRAQSLCSSPTLAVLAHTNPNQHNTSPSSINPS